MEPGLFVAAAGVAWWNSVMELLMAGGNYPVAEMPFPQEFSNAVQVEMEEAKSYSIGSI